MLNLQFQTLLTLFSVSYHNLTAVHKKGTTWAGKRNISVHHSKVQPNLKFRPTILRVERNSHLYSLIIFFSKSTWIIISVGCFKYAQMISMPRKSLLKLAYSQPTILPIKFSVLTLSDIFEGTTYFVLILWKL